ncbi:SRPBCC domain-containing protein [Nocardioides sp. NBC_00163]|uniref:CoxG family protein n=1 Tax=Nocardioides sp. NBC_00163 TaxID=2975999 RepID=UPI00324C17F7
MKLASSFLVPGSPDKVLNSFLDPAIMQVCLPGCEEVKQVDDNTYRGSLVNEVAHVKFKATFIAEITERDIPEDTAKPAMIKAVLKGEDRRLGSTVKLDALLTVSPVDTDGDNANSQVSYEMEMAMWGKLGRLGEAVIRRRTAEVEAQFAEALAAVCAGKPVPTRASGKNGRAAARTRANGAVAIGVGNDVPGQVDQSGQISLTPVPVAPRSSQDLLVLGLAVAAAFAYGVIAGGRARARR